MKKIVVIGGGIAGYSAAIRAAQLGAKVVLIEKKFIGGTCLNRGCITTKTMLHAAKTWRHIRDCAKYGIEIGKTGFNLGKMLGWVDEVVSGLRNGIEFILDSYGIEVVSESATLSESGHILAGGKDIKGDKIIIASGSLPLELQGVSYDHPCVWDTWQALKPTRIPERMIILGGGAIGLELAVFYTAFGSDVTIVERKSSIAPNILDNATALEVQSLLQKKRVKIVTNGKLEAIKYGKDAVKVKVNERELTADKMVICVGHLPNRNGINLHLKTSPSGGILVNSNMQSSNDSVYAAGDVVGPPFLAHKAMGEAIVAAENAMGMKAAIDHTLIPSCIYTDPEIAIVGQIVPVEGFHEKYRFPLSGNGRAYTSDETAGFIQLTVEKDTGKIVGGQIIGANASELIHIIMLAIYGGMRADEIGNLSFAHPTFSEAIKETSRMVQDNAIHFVQQSRG